MQSKQGAPDTEDATAPDPPRVALVRGASAARRSVSEEVADHIRQLVFFGELRDGERIPQREIALALGVSSVPVREALAALQREGVVTISTSPFPARREPPDSVDGKSRAMQAACAAPARPRGSPACRPSSIPRT
jgi:DNA-binding transcriptional MocR family regulator